MSLKAIHIVFILASSLMTILFGVWAWRMYFGPEGSAVHLTYGLLAIVGLGALLVYGRYFSAKA